ncbi:MAG TPA: SHOCT domain-containing protein [Arthrobacter sp.]|nr:SHOCT domain-containing protein [Arthrobacter sp.]
MPFARSGRPGLLGTVSRTAVISGTPQVSATAAIRRATRREEETAAPSARTPPVPPAAAPPPPAGGGELADQLSRLADLHSAGLLTEDEFAAAKARLLM